MAAHPYRRPAERPGPAPAVRTRPIAAGLRVVVCVLVIVLRFGLLYARTRSVPVTCLVLVGIFTAVTASRLWRPA
jgi:hypothetical protein